MNKNPQKIKKMFDDLSQIYDKANNIISLGTHNLVKKSAINNFNFSGKVLDLCTGTGDIAELLKNKCDIIGVDFSEKMLEIAKRKHPDIKFIQADCTKLPFEDNSFDAVTISFGLRNIENYDLALDEIYRVLKPNGKFFHLDFGKKNIIADLIFDLFVPIVTKLFYNENKPYQYLVKSKQLFLNKNSLIKLFNKHKFRLIKEKSFIFGIISCQFCEKKQN